MEKTPKEFGEVEFHRVKKMLQEGIKLQDEFREIKSRALDIFKRLNELEKGIIKDVKLLPPAVRKGFMKTLRQKPRRK